MALPGYTGQPQPDWAAMGIPMVQPDPLQGAISAGTGIYDLIRAGGNQSAYNQFAQTADPYSQQRSQWFSPLQQYMQQSGVNPATSMAKTNTAWDQLLGLMQNPGQITSMPGYQFGLNQAMEGVNRGAGASGMLRSGNRLAALQDRGEGYASGAYERQVGDLMKLLQGGISADQLGLGAQAQGFKELADLAGVNAGSPEAAARMQAAGRQATDTGIGAGLGGIAAGVAPWLSTIQKWLGGSSGGAGGSGLGDLDQATVYGPGSNWAQDIYPGGGGGGFDPSQYAGMGDLSGFDNSMFDPSLYAAMG